MITSHHLRDPCCDSLEFISQFDGLIALTIGLYSGFVDQISDEDFEFGDGVDRVLREGIHRADHCVFVSVMNVCQLTL